jgi:hypothetical protein
MPDEELTFEEQEAVARAMEDRAFDARIVAELERIPDLSIPGDFTERVAAQIPERRSVVVPESALVRETHYGRAVMWVCVAVLFVALLFSAAKGLSRSPIGTTIELILYVQFLAIAVWLGVRRWRAS